jgi:SnoaL-like domain
VFPASPAESIAAYISAKDGNRPHLLDAAFTPDATLRMVVRTDAITFPPASQGRDAIAETLVRRFNQTYENVYTVCIGLPPAAGAQAFSCDWLVAMSEKQGGAVRIGCGRYDWTFEPDGPRVRALTITIEAMQVLPAERLAPIMGWASCLPYPWCSLQAAQEAPVAIPGVRQIVQYLRRESA